MAEIVVVTWDGGGNVPPAFAIAAELAARGHGIRVLGHRSQREAIEAAGFSAGRTSARPGTSRWVAPTPTVS